jgi:hypothetical protein
MECPQGLEVIIPDGGQIEPNFNSQVLDWEWKKAQKNQKKTYTSEKIK